MGCFIMKRVILVLGLLCTAAAVVLTILFNNSCSNIKNKGELVIEQYYNTPGIQGKIYGDRLVVYDGDLNIIDLKTKSLVKKIEVPGKKVLGFDIYEDKLVWSDLRNEKNSDKLNKNPEICNSDIFLYNLKDDTTAQITTDGTAQTNPTIWGNYIAWQDNRNDELEDDFPQWNIYLYNIGEKSERRITTAEGVHTNCHIYNNKLIWEDGRYARGAQSERFDYELPSNNTDIYMYDIDEDKYQPVAYGKYKECRPAINANSIIWEDRNNYEHNAEIMLYDIKTYAVKNLTKDAYNQIKPVISNEVAAWVDERRGTEKFDGIPKERSGNSDICLYDIRTGRQQLIEEEGVQTDCAITPSYVVYTSKINEKESTVKVAKYERKLNG